MTSVTFKPNILQKTLLWLTQSLTNNGSLSAYLEPLIQIFKPAWRSDRIYSKLVQIRQESADMYSLIIRPSKNWKPFKAGQYLELTVEKEGAWISRFFSISSSPAYFLQTGLIELSIQKQKGGFITPWLPNALSEGSIVNLSQAQGEFFLPNQQLPLLMIAGGSGITPFRAMLQQLCLLQKEQITSGQVINLCYYARSPSHFLFRRELERFTTQLPNFNLHLIDSEERGFLSEEHLKEFCPDYDCRTILLCGPSPMIVHGRTLLKELKVKKENIMYEFFGPEPVELKGQTQAANILFKRSNKQIQINENKTETLLNLAEQANIKAVSGCRIGVCHQCICQKKSGVVYNSKTQTYSDTGPQEIQLCISVPVSDLVLEL